MNVSEPGSIAKPATMTSKMKHSSRNASAKIVSHPRIVSSSIIID